MKYPTISIVIPTINEEKNIRKCLKSVYRQDYQDNKLEVIVVDNGSSDKTVEIAKGFGAKILHNSIRHGESSKMIGFRKAKGELAMYLDADMELVGKNWLKKMVAPLEDDEFIASVTTYVGKKSLPALERYYNFDPLQRDSLIKLFSPGMNETIVGKKERYYECLYKEGKIPPMSPYLFRRVRLLRLAKDYDYFFELDFLVLLVRGGFNKFAYVKSAGIIHHHVSSLKELLRKRLYNLNKVYFGRKKRLYRWIDFSKPADLTKLIAWIIYVNLIFPSVLTGIYKSIKHCDVAGMYEPVVNFLITNTLVLSVVGNLGKFTLLKND